MLDLSEAILIFYGQHVITNYTSQENIMKVHTSLGDHIHYLFEKGIYDYDDLDSDDKCQLTGELLADDNIDNQMDFVREAAGTHGDFENSLMYRISQYLIHQDSDSAFDLLEEIKNMGNSYYRKEIGALLKDEVIDNFQVLVKRHSEILENRYDAQRSL